MIDLTTSNRNLVIRWDSMAERKVLDKIKERRPIYKVDADGDSVLHHYEFPKNAIRDILAAFDLDKFTFSPKALPFVNAFIIETTPIDDLDTITGDLGIQGTPRPFQEKFLRISKNKTGMILSMSTGSGKEQPLYSKILTPRGWKLMGDILPGDFVIGQDGKPKKVYQVFPQGIKPIYEITFSDKTKVQCGLEHLWQVQTANSRSADREKNKTKQKVLSLKEIIDKGIKEPSKGCNKENLKRAWHLPMVEPVQFEEDSDQLKLDPYFLGLMLGDGGLAQKYPTYCTADLELLIEARTRMPKGMRALIQKKTDPYTYEFKGNPFTLKPLLNELKLLPIKCENRFVPLVYKYGSVKTRLEILKGLLDTDGYCEKRSGTNVEFVSKSYQLYQDVREIVQSLGGNASEGVPKVVKGVNYYRTIITIPMCPFRLTRKVKAWKPTTKYHPYKCIESVEYIGDFEAQCISVDGGLYITDGYTVTHNTKTALWRSQILEGSIDVRLLVICPKRLLLLNEWEEEIEKTLGQKALRFWAIGKDKRQKLLDQLPNFNIVCTSYDQAAFLEGFEFDHLIIDEGHLIRGDKTKRHKAVAKKVKDAKKSITINTATPKPNKLSGLWALLKLVAPNLAGSKKSFLARFQKPTKFMNIEKVLPSGILATYRMPIAFQEINHEELNKFISPVVYTVPKHEIITFEDCLEFRDIEMLPKQKQYYKTLAAELLEKKKNRELEDGEILQYLLRLRQISEGLHTVGEFNSQESNKLNFVRETINDLDEDEHIIIWSCFQKGIKLLHEEFKDRSVLFCGTVTPNIMELGKKAFCGVETPEQYKEYERLRNKQKNWPFEPGEATILLGVSHDWTSLGINLQALCSRQMVLSANDLWDTDAQAWARISRLGQKADHVLTECLFSKGTADKDRMLDKLEKQKLKTDVLEGKNTKSHVIIDKLVEEIEKNL